MPELPETETIARALDARVRGTTITAAIVARADILREATAPAFTAQVTGARIDRCWRRAKCVVLDLSSGDRIVVTPRFTGGLFVDARPQRAAGEGARTAITGEDPTADYTALTLMLDDGRPLRYRDVRRLGTVALMDPDRFAAWDARIGPEPLDADLTAHAFSVSIRASRRAIKTVLMDQRVVAGVGNIYANEALWAARVAPSRAGARVTYAEGAAILGELRRLLTASIAAGGTTFRDYRDPAGNRGSFAGQLQVYGRAEAPCLRCGTPIATHHRLERRATFWCRECQR